MLKALFSHRPGKESIEEFHSRFLSRTMSYEWMLNSGSSGEPLRVGIEGGTYDLSHAIGPDIQALIRYSERHEQPIDDLAIDDDTLTIVFSDTVIDYAQFCCDLFPRISIDFECYRAELVLDDDLNLCDWELMVKANQQTGVHRDDRNTIFRVPPVGYFSADMLKKSLGMSIGEVQRRLDGSVEILAAIGDGLHYVATTEIVERSDLIKLHDRLAPKLGLEHEVAR